MKKLFSLLTLLLLLCTSAWGADVTLTVSNTSEVSETFADGSILYSITSDGVENSKTKFGSYDIVVDGTKVKGASLSDKRFVIKFPVAVSAVSITGYNSSTRSLSKVYTSSNMTKNSYTEITSSTTKSSSYTTPNYNYTFTNSWSSPVAANTYIWFEFSNALNFYKIVYTPSTPSLVGAWSPSSGTIWQGDAVPTPSFGVTASNSAELTGTEYSVVYSIKSGSDLGLITITGGGTGFTLSNNVTGSATLVATLTSEDDAYLSPDPNTFEYVYTVNAKVPTYTLNKTDHEISLRSTPVHRAASTDETATVTMEAGFLEGTSGTVAFVESVDGLSVSPTSFTISSGSVAETSFTITYNSESGNSGSATLRFTDGNGHKKDLLIDYTSVVAHTWATVSTATTWDWTKLSTANVKLTTETTPTKSEEFLLGDMDGEVLAQNIGYDPATFNADALKVITEYAVRDTKYMQGTQVSFKTSVPGIVTVTYSNTGGSRPYRHIEVNGVLSAEGSASQTLITTEAFAVNAGEVVIKVYIPDATSPQAGNDDVVGYSMAKISEIVFTPVLSVSGTIGTTGWTTFASPYRLDLSTIPEGFAAYYAASLSDGELTVTSTTAKVDAGEGLLIKGTAEEAFTINTTPSNATFDAVNLLKGCTAETAVAKDEKKYVLVNVSGTAKFQSLKNNGATIPAGKAYLDLNSPDPAPGVIRIVESTNNATNIEGIETTEEAVKFIQNGQLFIKRNGVVYDVMGHAIR